VPSIERAFHCIDFFGDEAMVQTDGAGGRNWTERLPVRFEWLAAAREDPYQHLYIQHVMQASQVADFDFLVGDRERR
jgi:hypothetical protein